MGSGIGTPITPFPLSPSSPTQVETGNVVGPTQPMNPIVQENYRQMQEHVRQWNPQYPQPLIEKSINTRLRMVQDRRMWGGLLVRGQISIPATYTTGTVDCTNGSSTITGTDTAWPINDLVDTTTSGDITATYYIQDVTPVSMTNINAGDWLVLDVGNAGEEVVLVISITSTTFRCIPTSTHSAGVTVTKSSLVRRQFRESSGKGQYYNVKAVTNTTELILDLPFGGDTVTGSSYNILRAYVSMEMNLRMVWCIVNHNNGWKIRFNLPAEALNTFDVWRTSTGFTTKMVDYVPDEIGRFRYELYPPPTEVQSYPYLAYRTIPDMTDDEDTTPPGIPSHVIVHGAIADALRWGRRNSQYYDPQTADKYELLYERDLNDAMMADDSIYMTNLKWAYDSYGVTFGADFWQSHDIDSVYGWA